MCPIGVDGKMGAKTCGAARFCGRDDVTITCRDFTDPTTCAPAAADCRTTASLCDSTQSCDPSTGDCFEDCRKTGAAPCGAGQTCDQATGSCVTAPPAAKRAAAGAGAGVFVLGLAALLGIGFALAGRG